MRSFVGGGLTVLAMAGASAAPLRLCMDEQAHPPYILADGGGTVPLLMRMAAERVGMQVEISRAPLKRCLEEIRLGLVQGYPSAGVSPETAQMYAYPHADGKPDAARATVHARQMVFRRKGGAVNWDGERFSFLAQAVLHPSGSVAIHHKLDRMKVAVDEQAKSMEQNFAKLVAGRGDAVVGLENDGLALLAQPRFAGRIEMLPAPFMQQDYYLMLSKEYYAANSAAVEALWTAIGKARNSAEYRAAAGIR